MMKSSRKSVFNINRPSITLIARLLMGLALFSLSVTCISCKKKGPEQKLAEEIKPIKSDHKWYYFDDSNILPVDKPQNVPVKQFIPWTEAVRISSANNSSSASYAIVNRLGILCFNGDRFSLEKDISLFSERTAQNLVFFNDTPIFSVYKSAFFNNTILQPSYSEDDSLHYFLVQFDGKTKISYPLINSTNLTDIRNTEVVDYIWDGKTFTCCLKSLGKEKTDFSYVRWSPVVPILSLSPVNASENIIKTATDVKSFRDAKAQIAYAAAPERIKKMLAGFSDTIPFSLEVKTAGGYSTRKYLNQINTKSAVGTQGVGSSTSNVGTQGVQELKASAILAESWSAVLFEDGTFFIEGALPGKHILRGGKTVAIRLPKLPPQFVYSDFVISGTSLYAAWEESAFFKTSRSGFLSVDLDSTLYKVLR